MTLGASRTSGGGYQGPQTPYFHTWGMGILIKLILREHYCLHALLVDCCQLYKITIPVTLEGPQSPDPRPHIFIVGDGNPNQVDLEGALLFACLVS